MTFIAIISVVLYVTSCFSELVLAQCIVKWLSFWDFTVYPENGGNSEVFIAQLKDQPYSFNAITATDVCRSLGVSIATRAQVETA